MSKQKVDIFINGNPFKGADIGNEKSIIEIAEQVVAEAKALAPVDLGQLRNSIMFKTSTEQGGFNDGSGESARNELTSQPTKGEGFVGSNLDYAIYQEFGTRRIAPQPYLRPAIAVTANPQKADAIIKKISQEEMLGALKKGQKRVKFL